MMKKIFYLLLGMAFPLTGFSQCDKASVTTFQEKINSEFANAEESPLKEKDRKKFKTLDFFPVDLKYCVTARLVKATDEKPFTMPTTGTRKPLYIKYGELSFKIDGKDYKLNVYRNLELAKMEKYKKYLFLPFTDLTSGVDSYGGGRYIDLEIPDGDSITIDFNKAYNPYCAYNEGYSCPIPPQANDLKVEIRAGVKAFHK